jgi:metal-responsive CopG/Arc/MetJ family transcriptional regulator
MQQLVSISILSTNRQETSARLNQVLTDNGHLIMSRLGVNVQKNCTEHCPGMIVLVLKDESEKIKKFSEELEAISGLEVQCCFFEEK